MPTVNLDRLPGGVLRVVLARPQVKNAMDRPMIDALTRAIDEGLDDGDVQALVITGDQGNFSAGGDIAGLRDLGKAGYGDYHRNNLRMLRRLAEAPKPTVAAIEGACAGGAAGLALCCDQVVIGRNARFGIPFLRIGLVPDMGVIHSLVRRIGFQAARRLALDGRMIDGAAAAALGIADLLVEDGAVQAAAVEEAMRLAALPSLAFSQTKRLLRCAEPDFLHFLDEEFAAQALCFGSDEFNEGVAAFLEKRTPIFPPPKPAS